MESQAIFQAKIQAKKCSIELPSSILNSEFSGVRRDRDEVSSQLERERAANRALRTEAAIADSEAIRVQRESLVEMARIRSVLTEEQGGNSIEHFLASVLA